MAAIYELFPAQMLTTCHDKDIKLIRSHVNRKERENWQKHRL